MKWHGTALCGDRWEEQIFLFPDAWKLGKKHYRQ